MEKNNFSLWQEIEMHLRQKLFPARDQRRKFLWPFRKEEYLQRKIKNKNLNWKFIVVKVKNEPSSWNIIIAGKINKHGRASSLTSRRKLLAWCSHSARLTPARKKFEAFLSEREMNEIAADKPKSCSRRTLTSRSSGEMNKNISPDFAGVLIHFRCQNTNKM